jgi:hypothetical protein
VSYHVSAGAKVTVRFVIAVVGRKTEPPTVVAAGLISQRRP